MARGNMVYMLGKIEDRPLIKLSKDGSEYKSGRFSLLTARRSRLNSKQNLAGNARSDEQLIISRSSYMIENKIAKLEKGDLVLIKGSLSTREIVKKLRCPYCGEIITESIGVMVYVDPVMIMKIKSVSEMSEDELNKFLINNAEVSNYAMFFGTLVREPRYGPDYGSVKKETDIQIALNRKRLIPEDGPDKTTDYPYVKMFGKMAEECAKVLHTGSEIYIEGSIQTRAIEQKRICSLCSEEFLIESVAVEIVPYSVEYISNVDVDQLKEDEFSTPEEYGSNGERYGAEPEKTEETEEAEEAGEIEEDDISDIFSDEYSGDYSDSADSRADDFPIYSDEYSDDYSDEYSDDYSDGSDDPDDYE